jgi:hypothetical protein
MADFQVHLESLSDRRKKARRPKPMKPMKLTQWPKARMKGLHHHHPRQMASVCLQQHPRRRQPQRALKCWLRHL